MTDTVVKTATGAILYDPDLINQISEDAFTSAGWKQVTSVRGALGSAGRGNTLIVTDDHGDFVLRHYIRGGLVGRLLHDSYLWTGMERTRAFREWRLLAELHAAGLPVPKPAAARVVRSGWVYGADLLTAKIPDIRPLSDRIAGVAGGVRLWRKLGAVIRDFHDHGVYHADLNAYNVQIGKDDDVYLLDFDRGGIRPPGAWTQSNLRRLQRSLRKICGLDAGIHFSDADWDALLEGYADKSRFA